MKRTILHHEIELIERSRLQDQRAFAALVEAYTPAVYRIVRRMVTDTLEAESIVQETFWRFWQRLPVYKTDAPLLPYLATIASNLARDHYRREKWLDDRDFDDESDQRTDPNARAEDVFDHNQTLERLSAAIERLPAGYRAVISLRYDAGMDYEGLAAALSLPLNTVRTHLRRAKQMLRAELDGRDETKEADRG
jgi:RNA polymerase sigma-70 factor (ECF subfamily)